MNGSLVTRRLVLGGAVGAGAVGLGWLLFGGAGDSGGEIAAGSGTTTTTPPASSTSVMSSAAPTTTSTSSTTAVEPTSTEAPTTTSTEAPTTTSTSTSVTPEPAPAGVGHRDLIGREGWGAAATGAGLVGHTIDRLTVHHTAGVYTDNTETPGRIRGFQSFHQEQGWADLAYHHVIDRNGNVYEARPTSAKGDTFTGYDPTGHYLVVCDGDFTQQIPTDAQVSALVDMLAWAAEEFAVSPDTLGTHRDYAATACPGDGLGNLVDSGALQAQVEAQLAAGGSTLNLLSPQDSLDRVATIEAGNS
ncbi:MAG: N-acetylmuramoyl-L-alanine amidase [Actinomycetia bacterium]|nr:N-acetylmuramoyl-L-alanine amidase [Actinomycetes bacterium]